jgi:hypothetical protein
MRRLALIFCFAAFQFHLLAGPAGPVSWGTTNTIVSGDGWGRMIQLTNGVWAAVSTHFGANSRLHIFRSLDATNWFFASEVSESGRDLDNGELIPLPDGSLLLSGRSTISSQSYKLPVYRSTDRGLSWTYLSTIDSVDSLGSRGLWEPDFWILADGRLVATYSNEKHDGYSQIISEKISTNGGASWGDEIWAVSQLGGGTQRPGMSQIARMADGHYILVYEVVGVGLSDVHFKISKDGINWPSGLGTVIPCEHCAPFVMSARDGRLFVTSCENQVMYSEDLGATWLKIDRPAWDLGWNNTWPAIYQTKPAEVGAMVSWFGVHIRFGTLLPRPIWPQVFTHNFSAGDNGWSRYGSNITFVNGNYALNSANTYTKAFTGDEFWSDGILEGDVLISTPGNAGLMFRTTNPDYDGPDAAFGYFVGLDTSGSVVLGRQQNSWTELARTTIPVAMNTWHHIKITLAGSIINIFVDDLTAPKITRADSTFARGQIGVRAFQCNAQFNNISFSNAIPAVLGSGRGLRGDYFEPDKMVPKFGRIDPVIDFDWGHGPAAEPSIGTNHFKVRWTGQIQPQFNEAYTFYLAHNTGAQLQINGQMLIDQWTSISNTVASASLSLIAGQKYDIRLTLADTAGNAPLQFAWSSSSTPWSVIPTSQLYLLDLPSLVIRDAGTIGDGVFRLNFDGLSNSTYSVWASTNLSHWNLLGTAEQGNLGLFSFTDSEATNVPIRFYRLQSP